MDLSMKITIVFFFWGGGIAYILNIFIELFLHSQNQLHMVERFKKKWYLSTPCPSLFNNSSQPENFSVFNNECLAPTEEHFMCNALHIFLTNSNFYSKFAYDKTESPSLQKPMLPEHFL